jgi:hypothetical protein
MVGLEDDDRNNCNPNHNSNPAKVDTPMTMMILHLSHHCVDIVQSLSIDKQRLPPRRHGGRIGDSSSKQGKESKQHTAVV